MYTECTQVNFSVANLRIILFAIFAAFQQPRSNEARYQKDILKNSRKGQLIRGFVLRCVSGTVGPVCPLQGVFAWNRF